MLFYYLTQRVLNCLFYPICVGFFYKYGAYGVVVTRLSVAE